MQPAKKDPTRSFLLWTGAIVVVHFIVAVWHLWLVVKTQPGFPGFAIPLLILVNLFPVVGLLAVAKGLPKLAGSMIAIRLQAVQKPFDDMT